MKPALLVFAFVALLTCAVTARALDEQVVGGLGAEDVGARLEAINALVASGDEAALALLQSMQDGELNVTPSGRVVVVRGDKVFDAASMAPIEPVPEGLDGIIVNNRIRGALDTAIPCWCTGFPPVTASAEIADRCLCPACLAAVVSG